MTDCTHPICPNGNKRTTQHT